MRFLKSGVHPTVAGVVLGLLTPAGPWFARNSLVNVAEAVAARLQLDRKGDVMDHQEEAVQLLTFTARETISPLDRLETALHPWVAFGIMPLFALANAGSESGVFCHDRAGRTRPLLSGLVLGKPLGIVAFSWIAVKLGLARLPTGVNWKILFSCWLPRRNRLHDVAFHLRAGIEKRSC